MDAKIRYKAKKVKIVFFDIDDTLRAKETGLIPESVKDVFHQLKKKEILTGIATGRGIFGVVPELMDLKPDFLVTLNGAYIEDAKGNVIYQSSINEAIVSSFVDWAKESEINYGLVASHQATLSNRTPLISDAIDIIYPNLPVDPDLHLKEPIFQMWTFDEDNDGLELSPSLQEELRLVPWHPHSSDVVRFDRSKASGVSQVVHHLDLKPENVLVFGDGLNDLELFDYAGISIAMGKSAPELREKADYITKNLEENGIFYALEELNMVEKELTLPQLELATIEGPIAVIKTNYGEMKIKLFPDQAPKTVANFVALAKSGYYDGIIFHRIIKDFMIQGGDPTGTGMGGESIYGDSFEDEFSKELYNIRGALSMANAGPNTNGSQFFIVQNQHLPYSKKELVRGGWPEKIAEIYTTEGGTPHLDQRHTVFGQLMDESSFAVLDEIAAVETGMMDKPVEDVVIETVEIED